MTLRGYSWKRIVTIGMAAASALALSGCASFLPTIGPSRHQINSAKTAAHAAAIQFVDINDGVTSRLRELRQQHLFSESLTGDPVLHHTIGKGDLLEVNIWAAAPATLFGTPQLGTTAAPATTHATTLPEQPVDDDGSIYV